MIGKPCCERSLANMQRIVESADLVRPLTVLSPFITALGSGPRDVDSWYGLFTTSWDLHRDAFRAIPEIERNRLWHVASAEVLRHQKEPDLVRFWKRLELMFR